MAEREPAAFGELLRRHRLAAGLTQEALAEQAGLSARGIADLERGVRRFPHPNTVRRLVTSLALPAHEQTALAAAGYRVHRGGDPLLQGSRPSLPIPPTSFVGRDDELQEVQRILSGTRLLTLSGPGGVGKTRLALALASAAAARFDDGVWFVDLASLADESLIVKSVASTLGVRERPGGVLIEIVLEALAERPLLLVIDNCEHLLPACAGLVERLLRQCALVRVLLTSREALRIGGETLWRVPSLRVPDASQLFVERARALDPGLGLDERRTAAIAHICQRLDGVPLAIELAAARVTMFSVEQIASRLDQSFRLLSSGTRTAPPRHQTLRATIDWSYGLLADSDRLLLDRLSSFAGGWTLEAAEAVASGQSIRAEEMLDLVGRLVDRSLVVAEPSPDGTLRYRLLEVLRQYGQERLAERGQIDSTRQQHGEYFLSLAEDAEPRVLGPDRKLWLDRLELELDNFRAARRWFVSSGATDGALRLAAALYRLWMYRGYANEGRASLAEALAMPGGSPVARANALFCDGGLGYIQADYAAAQRQLRASLALRQEFGDASGSAWALMGIGAVATLQADFQTARRLLGEACHVSRACGDSAILAMSLAWSADMAYAQGDFDAAQAFGDDAVTTTESIGFATPACMALSTLGNLQCRAGATDSAADLLHAALARTDALDEAFPIVRASISLAWLAVDTGKTEHARVLLERSIELAQRVGNRHHIAQALEAFAAFAALTEDPAAAIRLAGAAAAMRHTIDAPLAPTERMLLDTRLESAYRCLEPGAAAVAFRDGQAWSIDRAIRSAGEIARARNPRAARLRPDSRLQPWRG
jgi:predicted ATPase/transcriptional regulator with XRE-family HTH domain